jgi:DNA invertase Pin-like site-specific DNA recombinase
MTNGTRVIGYVRASTKDQAENGTSFAAQRAAIEDECERKGWELLRIEEDALSGRTTRRPGLQRALTAVRGGEAQALVAAKLDRLSRSVLDFAKLLEEAQRDGWNIVALDFGLDMTTPQGELVAGVLMNVAQWERRVIAQRTKDGLAVRRAEGVRLGRPRALPVELRKRIVGMRGRGMSLAGIAEKLNADGVATAHGGARWYASTVNRVLAGERR